jgi:flagellar biosynthesis chaperone FliJ
MPFRYRLQTLLEQKCREKDEAQQKLLTAQQALRLEKEELQENLREEAKAAEELSTARAELVSGQGGSSGAWIHLRRDHLAQVKDRWNEALDTTHLQEQRVREAEEDVQQARTEIAVRSRDVEILEKHRSRAERKFLAEVERKEVLDQEEMADVLFLRGRSTR